MKTKLFILAALLCGAFAFTSCDSDDNEKFMPEEAVAKAFSMKYPEAKNASWESKAGYAKAGFYLGDYEAEAWFNAQGVWVMTETDIPYRALPQAVKASFETSEYANWKVDDVDMIERFDRATIYIIEVENGDTEIDLYFTEDGVLIKEVIDVDNDDERLPFIIPDALKSFIQDLYPGAVILEVETERDGTEVEIKHGNIYKEVKLDKNNQWLYTKWEIAVTQLPTAVLQALRSTAYASYEIDDIEVIENASGLFYEVELEKGKQEITLVFSPDGTLINQA